MSSSPVQILLIEDNPGDARLIKEFLGEVTSSTFELDFVDNLSEGLRHLDGKDAILLDLALPDSSGLDTFEKIHSHAPAIPIIVLTGTDDDALAFKAVREGAQDYLVKGQVSSQLLGRTIQYAIERKRINEELEILYRQIQQHSAELERTVAERTKWLEAANRELESFSYSVSHDLRAPLRAMDGFSRILLEEHSKQLSPDAKRYLQLVRSNAQQMSDLIDKLLAFSRLGRQPLNKQSVMPIDIVNKVLEELQDEQAGRHIDVVIGDLPACEADPTLLKQVFVNLISNALKFTRRRETARIEIGSQEREGTVVYFVKDNGAGFDMKYVNKLFGVFQRLHSTNEYEGTGVGLANVQRIIHRHGGKVWAEGEVDNGATVYFTINGSVLR
jgi:signal transduction histidine kinase